MRQGSERWPFRNDLRIDRERVGIAALSERGQLGQALLYRDKGDGRRCR